jgi:hypothetical protein
MDQTGDDLTLGRLEAATLGLVEAEREVARATRALDHAREKAASATEAVRVLLLQLTTAPDAGRGLVMNGYVWWADSMGSPRKVAALGPEDWPGREGGGR